MSVSPAWSLRQHIADDGAAGDVDRHGFGAALISIAVPPVPVMVPELTMAPRKVATLFTTMPVWAMIAPELVMPPEKVEIVTEAECRCASRKEAMAALPPTSMPAPPAEILPELLMPPAKVETVIDAERCRSRADVTLPPTKMPMPTAEMVPELTIPPEKVEIVTAAMLVELLTLRLALPPTKMPLPPAEIVPESVIPPEKVEIVTDAVLKWRRADADVATDPDACAGRRNCAGITDPSAKVEI